MNEISHDEISVMTITVPMDEEWLYMYEFYE